MKTPIYQDSIGDRCFLF